MTSLVKAVKDRVLSAQEDIPFDQAIIDAMELAEKFEAIKPEEYVLPLDAMAGFRVGTKAGGVA